jgi:hypothetical protein
MHNQPLKSIVNVDNLLAKGILMINDENPMELSDNNSSN